MDLIILEEKIKYDRLIKIFLSLIPLMVISLAILFYIDFKIKDIFPGQTFKSETDLYLFILTILLVSFVYSLSLPKSILVTQEGLMIKFPIFNWKIPFNQIASIKEKRGAIYTLAFKWFTSRQGAILIQRKKRVAILICVNNPYRFIEIANNLLEEWRRYHPAE